MSTYNLETMTYRPNAGLMMINEDRHVFVGQRLDGPKENAAWQMPQGGIDEGEDATTAAFRELEEETGVKSNHVSLIATSRDWLHYDFPHELLEKRVFGNFRGQKQRWFLMQFQGRISDININTAEPEFSNWKWMPVNDLVDNIVPFKRHIYEQVIAEFKDWL